MGSALDGHAPSKNLCRHRFNKQTSIKNYIEKQVLIMWFINKLPE